MTQLDHTQSGGVSAGASNQIAQVHDMVAGSVITITQTHDAVIDLATQVAQTRAEIEALRREMWEATLDSRTFANKAIVSLDGYILDERAERRKMAGDIQTYGTWLVEARGAIVTLKERLADATAALAQQIEAVRADAARFGASLALLHRLRLWLIAIGVLALLALLLAAVAFGGWRSL